MQFTHVFHLSECVIVKKVDEKKIDSILKKIYYDLSMAGSYLGPDKLYTIIKKQRHHKHWKTHSSKMVATSR